MRHIVIFLFIILGMCLPVKAVDNSGKTSKKVEPFIENIGLIKKRYSEWPSIKSGTSFLIIRSVLMETSKNSISIIEFDGGSGNNLSHIESDELKEFIPALKKMRQDIEKDPDNSEVYYTTKDGMMIGFKKDKKGNITMFYATKNIGSELLFFPSATDIFNLKKGTEYFDSFIKAVEDASNYEFK